MSETAHTPGPWMTGGYTVTANNGNLLVAKLYREQKLQDAESDANARLIAAAPDMMEALKRIQAAFAAPTEWTSKIATEMAGVRAAIAKAEGRS